MKNRLKKILILVLTLVLTIPLTAYTIGVEVKPSKLNLETKLGKAISRQITIINPTPQTQNFEVYTDNYKQIIEIKPSVFTLEPSQKRMVVVSVRPIQRLLQDEKNIQTNISVVAVPEGNSDLKTGAGVKIPVMLNVVSNSAGTDWFEKSVYAVVFIGSLFLVSLLPKKLSVDRS